jgi:two-component system, cell cycle sensor histidine kinase and response regulator CckA
LADVLIDHMFEDIVETIPHPLLVLDLDLRILKANHFFCETFKIAPEKTTGNFVFDFGNRQWDIPKLRTLLEDIISKDHKFENFEVEHIFPNIGRKIMMLNGRRLKQHGTSSPMILLCIEDITEQREMENALIESEERYRRAFETASDAILLLEKSKGKITHTNPAVTTMLGYSNEECIGKNVKDIGLTHEIDDIHVITETLEKDGIIHYADVPAKTKVGQIIYTDIYLVDKARSIQCNIRDITERKEAEKALRESEQKYRDLVDNASVGVFKTTLGGEIAYVNDALIKMLEFESLEEFIAANVWVRYKDPKDREVFLEDLKIKGKIEHFETELLTTTGSSRNVLISEALEGDFISGMIVDITERKQAEEKLKQSEARLRTLFETMPLGIGLVQDHKIQWHNEATSRMLGYSREELQRKNIRMLYESDKEFDRVEKAINTLETGRRTAELETRWVRKDGSVVDCHIRHALMNPESKDRVVLAMVEDITERKKAEEEKRKLETQFNQAQKMEAVGVLAGGVAHDFNNILTSIIGNAELALMDLDKDTSVYGNINEIQKAGHSAAALTRQLLAFSRKGLIRPEVLDFNQLLLNFEKMLRRIIGEDIELVTAYAPDFWQVEADPGQMEQVIMNLAVNARDAMPKGGKLTIETANVELNEDYFREHGVENQAGLYVMLAVTDTGAGMDRETQASIFEPFFTTKGLGRGTGLGLSTVYGIVKQNRGHIWVYSEPGKGTTFRVYLPRTGVQTEGVEKEQASTPSLEGSETILVVEDDEPVGKMAERMLGGYGYRVLTARNGTEALEISGSYSGPVHLLLTDVVMPDMTGLDLAEQLKSRFPEIKVLYMSGYTDNVIADHGVLEKDVNFIQKPFSREGLGGKVREVLDNKR